MTDKSPIKDNLRSKAEAKIGKKSQLVQHHSLEETRTLLHELEVHQVELEMQNQELRESQHRLEEVRDQYTDLFDFAPVGYLIIDKKGIIININLTACNLIGIERSYVKGKPLSAYMSAGESVKLFQYLNEAFATGMLPALEIQMNCKDKGPITALLQGTLSKNKDNQKSTCRLSLQDITELKKAEALRQQHEDLQREKEKIQLYLDLAPVVFLLIDAEHNVEMINQKGCDLLGYRRHEILGKNWFKNFQQQVDQKETNSSYLQFKNNKLLLKPYFESTVKHRNGAVYLMGWTNTALLGKNGDQIGTLSAGEDITERKKIETEKQRYTHNLEEIIRERTKELSDALEGEKLINEMKSSFINVASHELRTPITIVMSSIILIEKYGDLEDYPKQKKHINRIKSAVDNIKNILSDILSLDQLEKENVRVDMEIFDLQNFAGQVIEDMGGMLKQGQRIHHVHMGNTEVTLDRKILRNILSNLLSNAIKYSDVDIDLHTIVEKGKITTVIKDKGIGIPEEEQQNLFVRFFRAKNVENIQGTGLGLSIVQRYLELLGGTIEFASTLDQGSTFTIILPQNS